MKIEALNAVDLGPEVSSTEALELSGINEDCDEQIDERAGTTWYADTDGLTDRGKAARVFSGAL